MKKITTFNGIVFKVTAMMTTVIIISITITMFFAVNDSIATAESKLILHSEFMNNVLEQTKKDSVKRKFAIYKELRSMMALSFMHARNNITLHKEIVAIFLATEGIVAFQAIDANNIIIISGYEEDGDIIYSKIIPPHIIEDTTPTQSLYPGDLKFRGYFNMDGFTSRIDENNDIHTEDFDFLLDEVENMQKEMMKGNVLKFATSIILSLFVLYLIIKIMVKSPLNKIKDQIDSFFYKLKNNENKISNINLNSHNELGLIAKFLDDHLQNILITNNNMELEKHNTNSTIQSSKLIQQSLIPKDSIFRDCFQDYFVYFKSKNIIGGDIYFFNEISKNKFLLMCIDCTGHNISGAFVSMSVSIIQTRLIKELKEEKLDASPAKVLEYFNKEIKSLFDGKDLVVGFDGGIILFDKDANTIKYAGANIPLYYSDDNKTIKTLSCVKYSVGYDRLDANYKYLEHELAIKENTKIYITTDGFIDQIGGDNELRFGKKRFLKMIERNLDKPLKQQMAIYNRELESYKNGEHQNDDITFIAMTYSNKELDTKATTKNLFYYEYEGEFFSDSIAKIVFDIEEKLMLHKAGVSIFKKILISVVEISQNISKYSKNTFNDHHIPYPDKISIKEYSKYYTISSLNIISKKDKVIIFDIIDSINSINKSDRRKYYNNIRRSGHTAHSLGAGIGFLQIATKCDNIDYNTHNIEDSSSEENLRLHLTITIDRPMTIDDRQTYAIPH